MVTKRSDGKTFIGQHIRFLPRFLASALDIYKSRRGIGRREDAIIELIKENPEIVRIVNEERLEARRLVLKDRRRDREGGQL